MEKGRVAWFDNAKLALMFCVVLGHLLELRQEAISETAYLYLYCFHMPAFVLISGYFYKPKGESIWRTALLYLLLQPLYLLARGRDITLAAIFGQPQWILWYAYCMLIWYLAAAPIQRLGRLGSLIAVLLSVVLGLLAGFWSGLPRAVCRAIGFFPYFLLGNWCRRFVPLETLLRRKRPVWAKAVAALAAIAALAAVWAFKPTADALYLARGYAASGASPLLRLGQYGVGLAVSAGFLVLTPTRRTCLTNYGAKTAVIYYSHGFVVLALGAVLQARPDWFGRLSGGAWLAVCVGGAAVIMAALYGLQNLWERLCARRQSASASPIL